MSTEAKTTTKTATDTQRVITVVTTRGEKTKINFPEGGEWEDLKKLLEKGGKNIDNESFSGYGLSNMKCVESVNRTTLEHPKAKVPDGNFNLFLMPYKSKSGGEMSRAEINSKIKEFITTDGDKAKAHFTVGGKNYTQIASSKLEELIESYKPGTKKSVRKEKAEAISEIVDSVKTAKANGNEDDVIANLAGLTTEEKLDVVIKLLLDIKAGAVTSGSTAAPDTSIASAKEEKVEEKESPAAKAEREKREREEDEKRKADEEKKRKKKEEDEKLDSEMEDMMGGFNDVKR